MTLKNWLIVIGAALLILMSGCSLFLYQKYNEAASQAKGLQDIALHANSDIQALNQKLGVAQSNLDTSEQLNTKYKGELNSMESDFKDIVKKYKLQLSSRDNTIATLNGKISGGTKQVTATPASPTPNSENKSAKIAYEWHDDLGRFHLVDPDIYTPNDVTFDYHLKLGVTGYVFKDKSGNVEVRKVDVQEVTSGPDGKYVVVPNSKVEVVDSKFEYTNEATKKEWTDIFKIRPLVLFDSQLNPGLGVEVLNLGNYIDWANVGLVPQASLHVADGLKGLQQSTLGIGLSYSFLRPLFNSNLALGVAVSTPFNNFGGKYIFTVEGIFYLID